MVRLCDVPDKAIIIIQGTKKQVRRINGAIELWIRVWDRVEKRFKADKASKLTYGLNCQMWVEIAEQEPRKPYSPREKKPKPFIRPKAEYGNKQY